MMETTEVWLRHTAAWALLAWLAWAAMTGRFRGE